MKIQDGLDCQYKVLLVEDDLIDAQLVRRYLSQVRRPRFVVECTQYLEEAIQQLGKQSYDAVLLDLNLPDCRSIESVDQLKAAWSAGPIITLTGLDEECHGIDAIRHGAADYLAKDGLSAALLSRTISYSIERHRMAYWIKATGQSKDDYLAGVCDSLRTTLSELLLATSVLVANDESLDPNEVEQVETIMSCGRRMSELIDDARPDVPVQPELVLTEPELS